jgi:hypothetical protein
MTTKPIFYPTVANAYQEGYNAASNKEVQSAYQALNDVNSKLFADIPVSVEPVSHDPYNNYYHMAKAVADTQKLQVFDGGEPTQYQSYQDTIRGRAVHDWFGHLQYDVDFSIEGEVMKWHNMTDMYPDTVTQLLFTEVVGQVCVFHDTHGFDYEQKPIILPPDYIKEVCEYYTIPKPSGWDYYE